MTDSSTTPPPKMLSRRTVVVLILLLAAALLIRLPGSRMPFWADESYTALTATADDPVASLLAIEHSPPLYYLWLMVPWSRISDGEMWFRMPSLILGAGLVLLAVRAGNVLGGPRAGAIAGIFAACDAYLVVHSREARSYMTAGFFSFWMFTEAMTIAKRDGSRDWMRFGTAALLACYTHYVQVILAAVAGIALLVHLPRRRTVLALGSISGIGLLAFLPWYAFLRKQLFQGTFYAGVWRGDGLAGWSIADAAYYPLRLLSWTAVYNLPLDAYFLLYYSAAALVLALGTYACLLRFSRAETRWTATTVLLGLAAAGILWSLRIVGEPVYILALLALVNAAVATGIASLLDSGGARRVAGILAGIAILAADASGIHEATENRFHLEDRLRKDPWPEVAAKIDSLAAPGDAVVVIPGWPSAGGWYFRDSPLPVYQIWDATPYFTRVAPYEKLFVGEPQTTSEAIASRHDRIWVVRHRPGHYKKESEFWSRFGGENAIRPVETMGVIEIGMTQAKGAAANAGEPR